MGRPEPAQARERWVRRRVGLTWALLVLNVLTFYTVTWNGQPLFLPVPGVIGKLIAQGALPAALLMALTVNRRFVIRPNVFLCLVTLLAIEAVLTALRHEYVAETLFGTIFRTSRLAGFVAVLWLLTPWWGRRDLLLVRCHLITMALVLCSVILGLMVAPGHALDQGRLAGVLWPIPPTQVAHYSAVTAGLMALLWLSGRVSGRIALAVVVVTVVILLYTHTRTALFAMVAGLLIAGLSLFAAKSRVRKAFLAVGVVVALGALTLADAVTHWLTRGENSSELTALTGRTTVWQMVVTFPRNWFEVLFGFGLSNNSFNGLPIDSNWLATYNDQAFSAWCCAGRCCCSCSWPRTSSPAARTRAMALFLATYCLAASLTETGLSQPSTYLLEVTLAASLLVPPLTRRSRAGSGATGVKILQVHNRYRSAAPSGENRVVDQEREALAALGHEVVRFERNSDEIERWPKAKKAIAAGTDHLEPRGSPRAHRGSYGSADPMSFTCTTLFRCSVRQCSMHAGTRGSRSWPPSTTTSSCAPAGISSARERSAMTVPKACPSRPCGTAATADRVWLPCPWRWPRACTGRHGDRWSRGTSSSRHRSVTCWPDLGLPPGRVFVRHNLIPRHTCAGSWPGCRPWSTRDGWMRPRERAC